jgi:hypothetical protein
MDASTLQDNAIYYRTVQNTGILPFANGKDGILMKGIMIIFSLAANLLSLYVSVRAIGLFLNHRKTVDQKTEYIICGLVWLVNWLFHFFFTNTLLTPISMFIGLLLIAFYSFEGSKIAKITSVISSYVFMVVVEQVIWLFLPFQRFYSKNETWGSIIFSVMSLTILLTLEYFIHFNKDILLPLNHYINIILLFTCSITLCQIIAFLGSSKPLIATFGLLIVCSINIFTLFQYSRITKIYQNTLEQKNMEQRIAMYENQFEIISEAQQNIHSLRHDFKKHLILLDNYIQKNDYNNALSYIGSLDGELAVTKELVQTENKEIDCILNYHLKQAEQFGCTINTKLNVPRQQFMSSFDLNVLLSNVLQNAIDAMKKTSVRILNIFITYEKEILYIDICNSFDGYVKKQKDSFLTTKPDTKLHGYGLNNIQSIVNKYNGWVVYIPNGEIFETKIILYLTSAKGKAE